MYAEASKIDPAYRAKAVAAASSAVQLIQIVVDVDCETFPSRFALARADRDLSSSSQSASSTSSSSSSGSSSPESLLKGSSLFDVKEKQIVRPLVSFSLNRLDALLNPPFLPFIDPGAAALSVEIEVLVLAMKRMGQVWSFGEDIGEAITLRMEALAVNGDEAYPETIHPTSRAS